MSNLSLATFRADVTPPIGHPLCGGWMEPAVAVTDPLCALGLVLFGDDRPVVLCALDWCEISNQSHIQWRERLAAAARTTPDRVAVQCMHPHCTPWPDEEAQRLVSQQPGLRHVMDVAWCAQAIERVALAVDAAVKQPRSLTHLGLGSAKVDRVASNRRVYGADGKVKAVRWTVTKDPAVRAEPEGLIDPFLKTISLWNNAEKIAALHYYAVHPTSYDNDRCVTSDFTGQARNRRNAEEPNVLHIYFTECAGNITAGKYNDGARENRPLFSERIYNALRESEEKIERVAVDSFQWRTIPVTLPPRDDTSESDLLAIVSEPGRMARERIRAAMQISYARRAHLPIPFTSLRFGDSLCIVHLPGEPFIEYQLLAQHLSNAKLVAVAGYGDCGPGYICLQKSFEEGGYEPNDSFVASRSESITKKAIAGLV